MKTRTLVGAAMLMAFSFAAASSDARQEGGSFQLVHGQSDLSGMGYYADPAEYLTDAQLDELRSNSTGLSVMLPTWLPEWTRDVEPVARVVGPTYFVNWSGTAEEHEEWQGELADEHLIALSVYNSILGPPPPATSTNGDEFRIESDVRSYWYDPDNIGIDEPVTGPGCTTSAAQLYWRDIDRSVRFMVDMVPNPDCSLFDHEHLTRVADSMVALSDIESSAVLLPEQMYHLFETSPSPLPLSSSWATS